MRVRVKGILFDMDGVLVSSTAAVERSWTKWAVLRDLEPELAIKHAHGRRSIDSIRALRPDLDAETENSLVENWEIADTEGIEVLRGVKTLIEHLPTGQWTIVTSATRRLAEARLGAAGIVLPAKMITADLVVRGKPDPEPYRKGAELLGLAPEDCLVIEDAVSGATAGRAAGCKVLTTIFSHPAEELGIADWIVESLDDVKLTVLEESGELELEFEPYSRP